MAKDNTVSTTNWWQQIFQLAVYKRNQGKITRQVTCVTLWVVAALAAWRLNVFLAVLRVTPEWRYVVCSLLLAAGLWLGFRLVNISRFADFLIAVEAEMNKVSWPTKSELLRSSAVVIFVIFVLAFVLFGFDFVWQLIFSKLLGIG